MKSIRVKTPAKINLTLEILGKRDDGYHELQSIMQMVNLYDYLTISVNEQTGKENSIEVTGNNPNLPYDKSNLAYISADKLLQKSGITGKKISIHIEKNIPLAAGLAGGSSNAAGVLWGLNEILNNPLDNTDIYDLASQIGSDVAFCLNGGTQYATSRGEKLERLETSTFNVIIAKPRELFISAREAYENYSKLMPKPKYQNPELMIAAIKQDSIENISLFLHNVLEEAILPHYPIIEDLKFSLIEHGCLNAIMSGSGPSVFGIYVKPIEFPEFIFNSEIFEVITIDSGVSPD